MGSQIRRRATACVALGLVVAAGCGGGGDSGTGKANGSTAASLAAKELASRPRRAALLALAAERLEPSVPAELSMLGVALGSPGIERVLGGDGSPPAAAIRTEHLVVGVGQDGTVRVWRPSGRLLGETHMGRPPVALADSAAVSSVAAVDARGALSLIDLTDPARPTVVPVHGLTGGGRPLAISFAGEASTIVVMTAAGTVERFDSSTGALLERWALREASGDLPWPPGRGPLRLRAAFLDLEADREDEGAFVGSDDGAVARVELAKKSGDTLLLRGVVPGRIVSLAGSSYADQVAVTSTGGLTTLRGPHATPQVTHGAFATGVGLDSEDHLWVGDREGVHSQSNPWGALHGPFVGAPAAALSSGVGGLLALGTDSSISLLGRPDTGLALPETSSTALAAFTPEGNLLTEEGAPGYVDRLETQRPGHGRDLFGYVTENPDVRTFEPDPEWLTEEETGLYVDAADTDRRFVVVGGQDASGQGVLMVWDAHSGVPLRRLPVTSGHTETLEPSVVTGVVLLPGKELVAAYSPVQKVVVLWSTRTWKFVGAVPVGNLKSLGASPDEGELMGLEVPVGESEGEPTAAPSRLVFIDVGTRRIDHHASVGPALAAAWSPDGQEIAVADGEHAVRLFSADGRGGARKTIRVPGQPVALAWRPDGRAIAVSLGDGLALVDPADGASSPRFPPTPGVLDAGLEWSPDGRFLAVATIEPETESEGEGYEPGPAQLWTLGAPRLARRMCQLAGGALGAGEWRRLVGEGDPRPLCRPPRLAPARSEPRAIPPGLDPTMAFRAGGDLFVADRSGATVPIAKARGGAYLPPAALWTRAGLAWAGYGSAGLLRDGDPRARSWPCACAGAVAAGKTMVALENEGRRLLVFTPGWRRPRAVAITGELGENPHLLGMLGGHAIVSAFHPDPAGTTQSTIYAIDPRGHAVAIGLDRGGIPYPPFAESPAGDELAFASTNFSGDCEAAGGVGLVRVDEAGRMRVSFPPLPFGEEGKVVRSILVRGPGEVEAALASNSCTDETDPERPAVATRYVLGEGGWTAAPERGFDVQRQGDSVVSIAPSPTLAAGGALTMHSPGGHTVKVATGVEQLWVKP
jgi:hypothetical protein